MYDEMHWPGDLFTRAEAAALGIGTRELTRGVATGVIRRLAHGLYAATPRPPFAEDRHRELCAGLLLMYPDAVLAGRSSVVALGLPTWGLRLSKALLHRPVHRQVNRSGAVIRPLDATDVVSSTATGPAQSPAAALVQVAFDHGTVAAVVSADAAVARRVVSVDELTEVAVRRRGEPRSQRAAAMLSFLDPLSESPGETRLRVTLASHGFAVTSQIVVTDGSTVVARADLGIDGTRVLIEFDGFVKYSDGGPEAVVREKLREDRLRALGYVVLRFTWHDLESPARVLAVVRAAVARDLADRHVAR
ncbi:type IV toxin-antitoxin system AbiEi family antitoxin domain-containing protein [Oryzobacter terrae]|uniref:type IV toxin-antitoxin system AbiEi family antitoxin domain-containing protein n=1 Tax=Oryzobacter terrae TaxID=1620385 RepID=UPI0036733A01